MIYWIVLAFALSALAFSWWVSWNMAKKLAEANRKSGELLDALMMANESYDMMSGMLEKPELLVKEVNKIMSDMGYPHVILICGDVEIDEENNVMKNGGCLTISFNQTNKINLGLILNGAHTVANEIGPHKIQAVFEDGLSMELDSQN